MADELTWEQVHELANDHREVAIHFAGRDTESLATRTAAALDYCATLITERANLRAELAQARGEADHEHDLATTAEAALDIANAAPTAGYIVAIKDKSHPSGLRYVMAYHDRATAELLLAREKERGVNTGMSVHAFRLLADSLATAE